MHAYRRRRLSAYVRAIPASKLDARTELQPPRVRSIKTRERLERPGGNVAVARPVAAQVAESCRSASLTLSRAGVFIAKPRRSRVPRLVVPEPFQERISAGSLPRSLGSRGVFPAPALEHSPATPSTRRLQQPRTARCAPGAGRPLGAPGSASPRKVPQSAGGHELRRGGRDQSWPLASYPSPFRA